MEYLDELKIPYVLDNFLVRGLDYYNRTVFEFFAEIPERASDGKDDGREKMPMDLALGGGGRYDYLIELLGGRDTPAVGGALGVERLVEVMKMTGVIVPSKPKFKVFLIHIGDLAKKKSLMLIEELRNEGVDAAESLGRESLKAQLRMADKSGAPFALIFGQKEALEESIILRDLQTGAQETITLRRMAFEVKRRLKQ